MALIKFIYIYIILNKKEVLLINKISEYKLTISISRAMDGYCSSKKNFLFSANDDKEMLFKAKVFNDYDKVIYHRPGYQKTSHSIIDIQNLISGKNLEDYLDDISITKNLDEKIKKQIRDQILRSHEYTEPIIIHHSDRDSFYLR